eukprot:1513880-Rhodomonas_salina.2
MRRDKIGEDEASCGLMVANSFGDFVFGEVMQRLEVNAWRDDRKGESIGEPTGKTPNPGAGETHAAEETACMAFDRPAV